MLPQKLVYWFLPSYGGETGHVTTFLPLSLCLFCLSMLLMGLKETEQSLCLFFF